MIIAHPSHRRIRFGLRRALERNPSVNAVVIHRSETRVDWQVVGISRTSRTATIPAHGCAASVDVQSGKSANAERVIHILATPVIIQATRDDELDQRAPLAAIGVAATLLRWQLKPQVVQVAFRAAPRELGA